MSENQKRRTQIPIVPVGAQVVKLPEWLENFLAVLVYYGAAVGQRSPMYAVTVQREFGTNAHYVHKGVMKCMRDLAGQLRFRGVEV